MIDVKLLAILVIKDMAITTNQAGSVFYQQGKIMFPKKSRIASTLLCVLLAACGDGGGNTLSSNTTPGGSSGGQPSASDTGTGTQSTPPSTPTTSPTAATPPDQTPAFTLDATARFNMPREIAVDNAGNVYVCDIGNLSIRRIAANGEVSTILGNYGTSPNSVGTACDVKTDASGNLIVLSGIDVLKVTPTGTRTLIKSYTQQPGSRTPLKIELDPQGRVYVLLQYRTLFTVDRFDADNSVQTVFKYVLNGDAPGMAINAQGTIAIALKAAFADPGQIAFVPQSAQQPVDPNPSSSPTPIAPGVSLLPFALQIAGDMVFDRQGNLYLADNDVSRDVNLDFIFSGMRIARIVPDGSATTLLNGLPDGTTANRATPLFPASMGIAVGPNGDLFIADPFNHAIYKMNQSGQITLIAGKPGDAGLSD